MGSIDINQDELRKQKRQLLRSVIWRSNDPPSLQLCRLFGLEEGFLLAGSLIEAMDGGPVECHYEIACTPGWITRSVDITLAGDTGSSALRLVRDDRGHWHRGNQELPDFWGLADIDLAISPATNTLPMRRLNLQPGQSAEVTALWVGFPELVLEPLTQRYTRVSEQEYHYESEGDFTAEFVVDDLGLMITYGSLWERC